MKIKLILFDFDGTIADSLSIGFDLYQQAASKYHLPPIATFEEYQQLLQLSLPRILLKLKVTPWKLARIIKENKTVGLSKLCEAPVFPDIPTVCQKLAQDHTLVIISSSLTFAIEEYLQKNHLDSYFTQVLGSDHGRDKRTRIKKCLQQFHCTAQETLMIGDSTRDMKDAHDCGVATVAVTYGIHQASQLRAEKPTAIVNSAAEIISAIQQIESDK